MSITVALFVSLAAASQMDFQSTAPSEVTREEVFKAVPIKRGKWQTTITIVSVEATPLEGFPRNPTLEDNFRSKAGYSTSTSDCIGDLLSRSGELVLPGITIGGGCTLSELKKEASRVQFLNRCGPESSSFHSQGSVDLKFDRDTLSSRVAIAVVQQNYGYSFETEIIGTSLYIGTCAAN